MKITLHRCEVTRTRDLMRPRSNAQLIERMTDLRTRGEHAARASKLGGWGEDYQHNSNKGLATYRTAPATVLKMCRRDWALTRRILAERLAAAG